MNDQNQENKNLESLDPAKKKANRHKEIVVAKGPILIMDMSWGDFMNEHNQKKVVQQLQIAYAFDKKADLSIPFIFTSVDLTWHQLFHRVNAFKWNKNIASFEQKSLLDINIPLEDMIYLTADTDNVCTSVDPTKYYIIGCILDHNSKKGVTHDFAVQHKIKMERLPIPEYITMEGRHVLTINHVAEIMIRVANGIGWADAFVQTIPSRKLPKKLQDSDNAPIPKKKLKKKDSDNEKPQNTEDSFWNWCNIF